MTDKQKELIAKNILAERKIEKILTEIRDKIINGYELSRSEREIVKTMLEREIKTIQRNINKLMED